MINKLTAKAKSDGELAVRWMSAKAQRFYYDTDCLDVYKVDDDEYCVRGFFDRNYKSLKEMEEDFEVLQDEFDLILSEE